MLESSAAELDGDLASIFNWLNLGRSGTGVCLF